MYILRKKHLFLRYQVQAKSFWGLFGYDEYLFFSSCKHRVKILNEQRYTVGCLRDKLRYLFSIGSMSITDNINTLGKSERILIKMMFLTFYGRCIRLNFGITVLIFLVDQYLLPMLQSLNDLAERLFDPFFLSVQLFFIFTAIFADSIANYCFYVLFFLWLEHTFTIRKS